MDSLLFTLAAFLIALAVLITVHELGHFWVARRLGVKVLRFSIGFGQPLWSWVSPRDGTEYVLAALPLGGYVKMLDEQEEPVPAAQRHLAFNLQPVWKRASIVIAGPLANLLFAVFAYWLVLMAGDTGLRPLIGQVVAQSLAEQAGLRAGEELVAVGDRLTPTWEAAAYALIAAPNAPALSIRARDEQGVERIHWLDANALTHLGEDANVLQRLGLVLARPQIPPHVGEVVAGEPAAQAGLRPGDVLLRADDQAIATWPDWVAYVRAHPEQPIRLQLERQGATVELTLTPRAFSEGKQRIGRIGANVALPEDLYARYRVEVQLGPLEALQGAVVKTVDLSWLMLRVVGRMVVGQASLNNLSGPLSIAESAGKSASRGFAAFAKFLALISISLGVLNLLPIPVLDGGHLLFFAIEAVTGAPLRESLQRWGQRVGMALLLTLMVLAFYMDLGRLLG